MKEVWEQSQQKDTGNYYNSSADFQATWYSQKVWSKVNHSETFSTRSYEQAISDINTTVGKTEDRSMGILREEFMYAKYINCWEWREQATWE